MGHGDRFRGQDPDNEFAYDDESSMQQDQGGRPPVQDDGYLYGPDETPAAMGGGMRSRAPDDDEMPGRQEDEFGTYEDAPPDDDTESTW
ncbi:hypothetical protein [Actinomadura sp. 3N508]|uniref:hypothetical protein n=1 Tax=Actinomadura sp. 3N508 TaxID=3375153 RepID=UPI00379EA55C